MLAILTKFEISDLKYIGQTWQTDPRQNHGQTHIHNHGRTDIFRARKQYPVVTEDITNRRQLHVFRRLFLMNIVLVFETLS